MPKMKISEDYYINGVCHSAGKVYEFDAPLCQVLIARNIGQYVDNDTPKKSEPETETDTPAKVTLKSLGRKRTVTEP